MTKTPTSEFSLTGLIDSWIAQREKKEYKSWRCSSLGGCPRAHFYKRLGITDTTPADERTQRVFTVGDVFHKFIQDIAEGESEQEIFDKELNLGGRYDLIVPLDDKFILYDIKTQHSRSFWYMENLSKGRRWNKALRQWEDITPIPITEQYPHHKMQIAGYLTLLKRVKMPISEGRIFYVSKDDLCTEEVTVILTDELEEAVLSEIALLNKCWQEKILPPCTCKTLYGGKGISYCDFGNASQLNKKSRTECCSPTLWKGENEGN